MVAGGVCIYTTVQRNSLDYQVHPVASLLGSIIPGIIVGFVSYGWEVWRARRKQGEPFPYGKACFVLLILVLFIQVIFGAAILAAISGGKTINKNVRANDAANNTSIFIPTAGNRSDGPKQLADADINETKAEKSQVIASLNVSDISLFSETDALNGTNYVRLTYLRGRIKNGSSKTITGVALKLLIFDSSTNEFSFSTNQIDTISVSVVGGWAFYEVNGKTSYEPSIDEPSQLDPNDVKPFRADVPQTFESRIPVGFRCSYAIDDDKVYFKP